MLNLDACRWCVQSISTGTWKKVHPCLSSKWLERDFQFWRAGTVRCYYHWDGRTALKTEQEPPALCPYLEYQLGKTTQQLLPIGNIPPDPRGASYVRAMSESIVENPTVDFKGKQLGKSQGTRDDSVVTDED